MANSADLQKPTDLDLHCLQRQVISGFSRTRVKKLTGVSLLFCWLHLGFYNILFDIEDNNSGFLFLHQNVYCLYSLELLKGFQFVPTKYVLVQK